MLRPVRSIRWSLATAVCSIGCLALGCATDGDAQPTAAETRRASPLPPDAPGCDISVSWLSDSSGRALFELSTRGPQVEERHIVMAEGIVVEVAGADPAERLLERRQLPGGEAEARLLRRRMLGAGLLDLAEGCYGFPPEAPEARVETLAVPTAGRVHRYAVENRRGPEELTSVLELLQARIRSLPPVDRDGDRD